MMVVNCNYLDCVHNDGGGCCEANSVSLKVDPESSEAKCATRKVLIPGISTRAEKNTSELAEMMRKARWGL